MVARVHTVAFQGIETLPIEVEVQLSNGLPSFMIVGLPDKAVAESKERVRSALNSMGLALPPKRITVNLSPADVIKEGSHFDLPIALGLLSAMEAIAPDAVIEYLMLGELGLDGAIKPVAGVLPAAMRAYGEGLGMICPVAQGGEAAYAGEFEIIAAPSLLSLLNHVAGKQVLASPNPIFHKENKPLPDLADIKGQEAAKRAMEIAAAGGHNLLMTGPPGSGKSMLAARLPSILPPLEPSEALQLSLIHSVAGLLKDGHICTERPYRDPHHSTSVPALVGGGSKGKPGEISLAHHGVLFLDELPEFSRQALESMRQPIETGTVNIARVNAHVSYPANFQLVAAMNPCKCGYLSDPERACTRAPKCALDYQARISGPLLDRIDIRIDVPALSASDLNLPPPSEGSQAVAARVTNARKIQRSRFEAMGVDLFCNAQAQGKALEAITKLDEESRKLMHTASEKLRLSARGYHRVLRVARTIADLQAMPAIQRHHIAEALGFRDVPYKHG